MEHIHFSLFLIRDLLSKGKHIQSLVFFNWFDPKTEPTVSKRNIFKTKLRMKIFALCSNTFISFLFIFLFSILIHINKTVRMQLMLLFSCAIIKQIKKVSQILYI